MEEVDAILISQLKEIGCDIEDGAKNVGNLDPIELMKCVAQCLGRILAEHEGVHVPLPKELFASMNMSIKFKIANQLSELIRDIGFKSDIGYQSFLYGNEHEVRRLLLFLIERIPREDESSSSSRALLDSDNESGVCRTVRSLRRLNLGTVWLPPDTTNRTTNYFHNYSKRSFHHFSDDLDFCLAKFLNKSQPKPLQRVSKAALSTVQEQYLLPQSPLEILEYNALQSNHDSFEDPNDYEHLLFDSKSKQQPSAIVSEQTIENTIEPTDSTLQAHVQSDQQKTPVVEKDEQYFRTLLDNYKETLATLDAQINQHDEEVKEFSLCEQDYSDKCKQYEANCKSSQELNSDIKKVKGQIDELTSAWQTVQNELFEQIDQLKSESMSQNEALKDKIQRVAYLKKTITSKMKDLHSKQELVSDLNAKLPEDWPAGRTAYTKRILEIITNVAKQNAETKKVLLETKSIQKEINALNGKIARSFAISEETIFRDAKQNDWNRKCYKTLALLHANFDQLLELVSTVGSYLREIRHLEEVVEVQHERCAETNLSRINADLQQIQAENKQLHNRLNQKQF